ncbi:WD40/YVTN/BNR-like repeat-containing protein [Streptomyces sp. NPDC002730]|uniref:WD40/YVTN/BNR-like repeat-containing protein n=1 Tax=Streptomyces sp. NPDC002730 TaxID=3364662 RepID=UPI003692101B
MTAGVIGLLTALLLTGCSADELSRPPDRGQNRERAGELGPGVDLGPGGERSVPLPRIPSAPGLPGWAHQVRFAADGSGFALLAQCVEDAATPDNNFCRQYVAVLDRGGSTWAVRRSPLPVVRGSAGISADLHVLGPARAWIRENSDKRPRRTWFTVDGGRSWRAGDWKARGTVAAITKGAVLSTECVSSLDPEEQECTQYRIAVLSPEDGRRRFLRQGPSLLWGLPAKAPIGQVPPTAPGPRQPRTGVTPVPVPASVAEPDGSWWVSGSDPVSGAVAVAVSGDAGRHWSVSKLPSPTKKPGRHVAVSVGRDAVYAAEMGELEGGEPVKNPMRALHRSRDGGRTWERMWTTGPKAEPRTLLGQVVPSRGGELVLHGEKGAYASKDGGRTFTRTDPGLLYAQRTPLGLLVDQGGCIHRITPDGVRWTEFRLACASP